ncbi:MAG: hypothetical protein ACP5PA_04500, partial [Elusimicrobiales bacterium]
MSQDKRIEKKTIDEIRGIKKKVKVEIDRNKAKAFLEKLKAKKIDQSTSQTSSAEIVESADKE